MVRTLIDRLRVPEHTGPNRCYPCTVVNVALVGVAAGLLGVVAAPVGLAVACLGLAAVWLRGYAVPGTPRLTRRYLPVRVLALFGKSRLRRGRGRFAAPNGAATNADDPSETLAAFGVLADADEPSLAASFEDAWSDTTARIAEDERAVREAAAEVLSASPRAVRIAPGETAGVTLTLDGEWVGNWPSRTALVGDLAAELLLAGDAWSDLDRVNRADLLARIRGLATACPVCGGETAVSDETVESCCRSADVVAVTCRECGDRLAEFERSPTPYAP
jgi:hypothetical protein